MRRNQHCDFCPLPSSMFSVWLNVVALNLIMWSVLAALLMLFGRGALKELIVLALMWAASGAS